MWSLVNFEAEVTAGGEPPRQRSPKDPRKDPSSSPELGEPNTPTPPAPPPAQRGAGTARGGPVALWGSGPSCLEWAGPVRLRWGFPLAACPLGHVYYGSTTPPENLGVAGGQASW
jgi:hypothetical protein